MFTIGFTSHLISVHTRTTGWKVIPIMIGLMAILLILRGLNLGIKYVSQSVTEEKPASRVCKK